MAIKIHGRWKAPIIAALQLISPAVSAPQAPAFGYRAST